MLASYRVAIRPNQHLFDVTMEIDGLSHRPLELWMPAWTPGSYLIREYARHVQNVRAEGEGGAPVSIERVSKDSWRLDPGAHPLVKIRYSVYAFDLSVRTSHLDESHAYFNGASIFLTADELRDRPASLTLDLPPDFKVETPLPREPRAGAKRQASGGESEGTPPAGVTGDGGQFGASSEVVYRARHYDELCDSPVHCGPSTRAIEFKAAGVPHRLAVWGHGNEDLPALGDDVSAIVEQAAALFGALPYQRYLFLTLLTDRGRGGLEHRDGATLLSPRFGFRPEKARQEFLLLAAHELFHAWMVKRLRPRALLPYRYRSENFTRLLWFFEGFTSYYETLLVLRAKLITAQRFLEIWGERITQLLRTPGRKVQSLDEASLTAWVKYYRQDENSANSSVSYYLKGSLVALALEGELRRRGQSVDALIRALWKKHGMDESGLAEDGVQKEAEALAGSALPGIFKAVSGTADPDFAALEELGVRVRLRPRDGAGDRGGSKPRAGNDREGGAALGLQFKGERLIVQSVFSDGPAEQAGLCPDDEILAADGYRLTTESCGARLEQLPPGTCVKIAYFRREELREAQLTLGERPLDTAWIERVEAPTEAQRKQFAAWTGSEL